MALVSEGPNPPIKPSRSNFLWFAAPWRVLRMNQAVAHLGALDNTFYVSMGYGL